MVSHMDNQSVALDHVFTALADPTRRAVIRRLGDGPASVTELAAPFAMALPSFLKHLGMLERCGLVASRKQGRIRTCRLRPRQLAAAESWIARQRAVWEARTDRLAAHAERLERQEQRK